MSTSTIRRRLAMAGAILATTALTLTLASSPSSGAPKHRRTQPAATASALCGGQTTVVSNGVTWVCSLSDEFDGTTLNRAVWTPTLTSNTGYKTGPAGLQACYTGSRNNVSVAKGTLRLTARKARTVFNCDSSTGDYSTRYTSGMVTTVDTFNQTYGRFEVRAKLPATTRKGLQETFWLWPVNPVRYGAYPRSGEIDFAEFYSEYYNLDVPFLHYWFDPTTVDYATNTNVYTAYNCNINWTTYNTVAAEWKPGQIRLLVNGSTCLVDNYVPLDLTSPAPFDHPFFLALTQALGVGTNAFDPSSTPLPATTYVDYVRIWRLA